MTKFVTLLIGFSLAFANGAQAKQAEQENPKNKKSQPVQKQRVAPKAPKQQLAPKQQQVAPRQPQLAPKPQKPAPPANIRFIDIQGSGNRPKLKPATTPPKPASGPNRTQQNLTTVPASVQPKKPALKDNARVHRKSPKGTDQNLTTLPPPPKHGSLADGRYRLTAPAVQSNKLKTVKSFQPRHRNFQAKVNPSVASVRFNQDFRIRNAENWRGDHYNAFRTYRPQWRDRDWWRSNHSHIVLIGGGWYYWNSGYWYPAWGYDDSAAYYPYDGPIYVGSSPRPFDQVVADVQSVLQEQGYYRGEVDGLVGPLTQEALAAYQSAQGLEPTAAIDQPTLESLGIT